MRVLRGDSPSLSSQMPVGVGEKPGKESVGGDSPSFYSLLESERAKRFTFRDVQSNLAYPDFTKSIHLSKCSKISKMANKSNLLVAQLVKVRNSPGKESVGGDSPSFYSLLESERGSVLLFVMFKTNLP